MSPSKRSDAGRRWALLLVLSAAFAAALVWAHLSAALLLGPMIAAIAVSAGIGPLRLPQLPFLLAQGVIGCLIARALTLSILGEMTRDWPLFFAAVTSVMAAAVALGSLLARRHVLPGATAIWGSFPGAATVMAVMAEGFGEDIRLVAFMQYLRVVVVAVVASALARIVAAGHGGTPAIVWFPPVAWGHLAETLALGVGGMALGLRLRVPAGALLVPMVLGAVLQGIGVLRVELPPWLLAASYALVGWGIGLRFTREIVAHVAHALPGAIASIVTLVAICGGLSVVLAVVANVDALTAYLAMSPGGADSVAIIAASSKVDVPFVMAMQTARLLLLLIAGPPVARTVARWVSPAARVSAPSVGPAAGAGGSP